MSRTHHTFANQRVLVLGAGKSGLAAARLLVRAGALVTVNDQKPVAAIPGLAEEASRTGFVAIGGGHPVEPFEQAAVIVLSPGIPSLPVVEAARARGATILSEVELASRFVKAEMVGITGTNGKSTVTTLVGKMLEATGRPTFTGGNLGDALSLAVGTEAAERGRLVVELSSFQLEDIETLRCDIAAILNITDDHLDRHGTLAAYAAAKGRIFANQRSGDHAVVPANDELCLALARGGRGQVHTFGGPDGEVRVVGGAIVDPVSGLRVPVDELGIRGAHNHTNACAATLMARLAGVPAETIAATLRAFQGLPHRMVLARTLDGVDYYDDSKATNVGATVAAIDGLAGRANKLVVILGGLDKGGSYEPVVERLEAVGRAVVLIGQATPLIEAAFTGSTMPVVRAASMDEAVSRCRSYAQPGDAVLLAPACASMDMFRNYGHRGDEFVRAVHALGATP